MTEGKRFCPNCGSTYVEPDTRNAAKVAYGGGSPNTWRCRDCGFTGMMPSGDPEEDFEEVEDIDFEEKEDYSRVDRVRGSKTAFRIVLALLVLISVASLIWRII